MPEVEDVREGGCLCGAVRYRVDMTHAKHSTCHCRHCQKTHGAPFGVFTNVPVAAFTWLSRPQGEAHASSRAVRRFCKGCGTPMTWEAPEYPDQQSFSSTTLDEPGGLTVAYELYTSRRLPFIAPIAGARQYETE